MMEITKASIYSLLFARYCQALSMHDLLLTLQKPYEVGFISTSILQLRKLAQTGQVTCSRSQLANVRSRI